MLLLQGNEACVEGAISAGMRFFAGYPITPSTEIAESAALRLPQVGGSFIQMEDEIAGMAAVIGASVTGVKSMTATSGPGFSLKQENIGYASSAEIPCVIVNVQRSGPSTGLPTSPSQADIMQARWGTHGDHPIIALSPSSVLECHTLMVRAFNLSEKYLVPVIFLMDEIVGHMRESVTLPSGLEVIDRSVPADGDSDWLPYKTENDGEAPKLAPFGSGRRYHITGLAHDERGYPTTSPKAVEKLYTRLMRKIELNLEDIVEYEEYMLDDAEVAIVCFGGTARFAKDAVLQARSEGIKAGMLRLITIWPFPEERVRALSEAVGNIIVAELNYGQVVLEVQRAASPDCAVSHIGRVDGTVLMPEDILAKIKEESVK